MWRHLAVTALVTCVTAWFSYAYFHIDEYFQVIELARFKLGQVEAWALPWEHAERMRPWLQPFVYTMVGRVLALASVRDAFQLAFVFRLVTGLSCVAALASFVRATLPWFATEEERKVHLRVATLTGFLPYLFVRTSSETASMAAATAGFAILVDGARADGARGPWGARTWSVAALSRPRRLFVGGLLLGLAFEARFQTAFLTAGVVLWLWVVGGARWRALVALALGGTAALVIGAVVDRWGYGEWSLPAWRYVRANVLEGAASMFGTDPPLSYFWMLTANVVFPVSSAFLVLAVLAWFRCPWHPITWATLPFFAIHNFVAHKEERFMFPIAILSTALVTMAIAPSAGRTLRLSTWAWAHRYGSLAKSLCAASTIAMAVLALYPLGWHHHVRFQRYVHTHLDDELHAHALPEFDLGLPAFHPRVYDIEKSDAGDIAERVERGTAKRWLVVDTPNIEREEPMLAAHTRLVWSELPFYDRPAISRPVLSLVDAYNARARAPLKQVRFRSLYALEPGSVNVPRPPTSE